MDLKNQLRGNFPKTIDKKNPVFSALIANDKGDAAIQKQLTDLFNYMKEWISTPDVYEQKGDMLLKTINFFSFIEPFADETEQSIKNRFAAIFIRNHDTRWGTPFDVKNVFRQYFPHATIYLIENTNKIDDSVAEYANLIENGDIEDETAIGWTLSNCAATTEACFSKTYGIDFAQSGGSLSQSVDLPIRTTREGGVVTAYLDTTFFLHFFLKGKINVQIKDASDKYWDNSSKTWKSSVTNNILETEDWDNVSLFFSILEPDSLTKAVTIYFKYVDSEAYADYFRLFQKQPYSSFTVIAHFEGNTNSKTFGLAAGDDDPNIETESATPPMPRYGNYGYFDKSFLSGVPIGFAKDIYEDLLDYLRSQGVRAYLDIVIKDYHGEIVEE